MGRSNPWSDLDLMSLMGRYGGHNHVCNISWLSVKGCGCGERGKCAFSHWLDTSPLQHWSHCRVTVWWPTNKKSYMVYRTAPFSMTLKDRYPLFQGHTILSCWISQNMVDVILTYCIKGYLTWLDLRNTTYRHIFDEILIETYTRPTQKLSFRMTSSDPEWLSKIFNDTRRARSLCDSWTSCL